MDDDNHILQTECTSQYGKCLRKVSIVSYLEHLSQTGWSQWMQLKDEGRLAHRHFSKSLGEADLEAILSFEVMDVKMVSNRIQRGSFNCSSTLPFLLALACLSIMLSLSDHLCLVSSGLPVKICSITFLNSSPFGESCNVSFKNSLFQISLDIL